MILAWDPELSGVEPTSVGSSMCPESTMDLTITNSSRLSFLPSGGREWLVTEVQSGTSDSHSPAVNTNGQRHTTIEGLGRLRVLAMAELVGSPHNQSKYRIYQVLMRSEEG